MRFAVLHHLESAGEEPAAAVYADVLEQVRAAEALGYEIAWVAEHHFSAAKGRAPSPLLFLMHAAGQTQRIRLGTAVLPAPFYHALRLAENVALFDQLSGGRLECGISSSGVPDEMRVFGVAQEGKHERLRESLLWLRRAWAGEPVSSSIGAIGGPDAVRVVPQPLQDPAEMVWVAASTPGAALVAGELGHHLLLPSLKTVETSAEHVALYRAALAEHGLEFATRKLQQTLHLILDGDHDRAMRRAEPVIRAYYARYTQSGAVQRLEDESLPAIMHRINFAAGGPEAVAEQIAGVASALSLTHVAFQARLIGQTQREILRTHELAISHVAPLLESAVAAG